MFAIRVRDLNRARAKEHRRAPGRQKRNVCRVRKDRGLEPWLRAELDLVKPKVLVCLGATAAQKLFGKDFRITKMRGVWIISPLAQKSIATYHPSAILRAPDEETRARQYGELVSDLKMTRNAAR